jgi:hypothetical protein
MSRVRREMDGLSILEITEDELENAQMAHAERN